MSSTGSNTASELDVWAIDRGTQRLIDHALKLGPICTFTVREGLPIKLTRKQVGVLTFPFRVEDCPAAVDGPSAQGSSAQYWVVRISLSRLCKTAHAAAREFQIRACWHAAADLVAKIRRQVTG